MLTPLLEARGVVKSHGGLRPFRLADLAVAPGDVVALEGPDEVTASVLVDLVTGTALPDAGEIRVAGLPTAAIADHEGWLAFLEQFGIVNPRVVLLEQFTLVQNLAVPLTLELDPLPDAVRERTAALAATVGVAPASLDAPLGAATPLTKFRVRLGRAIAHGPKLLLMEHPTLGLGPDDAGAVAEALRAAVSSGGPAGAALVITRDSRLARAVATRRLAWDAATGRLTPREGWRGWLSGR